MKVLILNGSPRSNGDTKYIIDLVKDRFPSDTEFTEINAYQDNIKPCNGCRYCWKNVGCAINDDMNIVLKDDYDVVIIASPIYMSYVTPPLFSIFTRFNFIWCNKNFLNIKKDIKNKKGILILVGGGNGDPDDAISICKKAFKYLGADFDIEKDYIYSLKTDTIPVNDDKKLVKLIERTIEHRIK